MTPTDLQTAPAGAVVRHRKSGKLYALCEAPPYATGFRHGLPVGAPAGDRRELKASNIDPTL